MASSIEWLLHAWLGLSILYMASAAYVEFRYHSVLPRSCSAVTFSIGAAMFVLINQQYFPPTFQEYIQLVAFLFVAVGWIAVMLVVRAYIRLVENAFPGDPKIET